jgi:hypothetical protein
MSSSFIDYKDYGFWARDTHIDLWLYLLVQEIDKLEPTPEWLKVARDHWHEQCTLALGGCIQLRLGDYLLSQDRANLVIQLSERVLKMLNETGNYLSGEYLNSCGIGGGGYQPTTNWEIEIFVGVGHKFIELLKHALPRCPAVQVHEANRLPSRLARSTV